MIQAHLEGDYIVAVTKEFLLMEVREFRFHIPTSKYRISYDATNEAAPFTMEELNSFMSQVITIMKELAHDNN